MDCGKTISMANLGLKKIKENDTLTLEDVRKLYERMKKQEELSQYNFPSKPSSDGYYHMYIKDDSKKSGRRQVKAKTLDELVDKVYEIEYPTVKPKKKTFKEVFNLVQEEKLKYVKNQERVISVQNSIKIHKGEYKRYFEGTSFEEMPVDEISKEDIENICLSNLQRLQLNKKAFLGMRGIIKSVFEMSFQQDWIDSNPYSRIKFDRFKDMLVSEAPISKRIHSEDDIKRMIEYIHDHQSKKPNYVPSYALELQILAGLRRGEVAPLEWTDITDSGIWIHKEQLTVRDDKNNPKEHFVIVQHTKTYVDRYFPITSEIQDYLSRLRNANKNYWKDSKYLFPAPKNPTGVINNYAVYHFYSRMCKKLGIEISKELTKGPHSFRRNGITKVANSPNGGLLMASIIYGNSVESASRNYYTGINIDMAKRVLES